MVRSKWRRWGLAVAAACAAGALPAFLPQSGVAKSDSWDVKELKNPSAWPKVFSQSVNNRGKITGYRNDGSADIAILWPDAESDPIELENIAGTESSWSNGINNHGLIAGYSNRHSGVTDWHAVLWDSHGALVDDLHSALEAGEYSASEAWVVNSRGDATGVAYLTSNRRRRAILWPRRGPAVTLGIDEATYRATVATAINDRGTACGYATLLPGGRPIHAAYWPRRSGEMIDLHAKVSEAMPAAAESAALCILKNDMIAGCAWEAYTTDVTVQEGWLYDPRDGSIRLLDDEGTDMATVWGGRRGSMLVGYLDDDWPLGGGLGAVRPALWERGKDGGATVWNLTILPVPAGLTGFGLGGCNSRGAFVGVGTAGDGTVHAFHLSR